ncbi:MULTISPECIES: alpha/beta fold hydrolase [unclassified Bradyrhizobium]|uniref:alpha/beta fold hydrolase n=1 Tax=unclassified Bradyrhizobium TaxID=2631580 RepID=UPI0015CBF9F5|nr:MULTISPECIES: alpha/beta hydrolase [unclassified Bradyrhizobium]MBB4260866.1 pimeloyl-ACP methyl ester carboxylesterase [Bradyrhizobium sp. CIR3A]NYG46012.1 pimeloyl-ACP methyl ester carboxylesterase [Bradyrhizobium sp. IAR9]
MPYVTSADGTQIAYSVDGSGPAVILTTGSLDDGSENARLATELSRWFRVVNYARRGRGESGDGREYSVAREIEDIAALIDAAGGGRAALYGVSTGGALALDTAATLRSIDAVAVYEVPYDLAPETPQQQRAYVAELDRRLSAGRRGDAVALFMELAGSSAEEIAGARAHPVWPSLERIAHTLAYDAAVLGTRQAPLERFARLHQPVLVATGGGIPPFEGAADALADAIPRARRKVLTGQGHVVDPAVMAAELKAFFEEARPATSSEPR